MLEVERLGTERLENERLKAQILEAERSRKKGPTRKTA